MSSARLVVVAYGHPAPQGSKRHVGNGRMIENSPRVKTWREDVKQAALDALEATPAWNRTAARVSMHVVFSLPRPRAHFRSGLSSHLLREDAPQMHATTPDLDKLIRSTCDALTTAGAYEDDKRVTSIYAAKVYVSNAALPAGVLDRPGARIVLEAAGEAA